MDVISVVIPVFNAGKYIFRCLESICNQLYENIEIICIDDGSLDNSADIIKEFVKRDNRITYIYQENRGVYEARRNGINRANGKYITFIDSDDWVERNFITTLYKNIIGCELSTCSVIKGLQNTGKVILSEDYREAIYDKSITREVWNNFIFDCETNKVQRMNGFMVNKMFITEMVKGVVNDIGMSDIQYSEDALVTYMYIIRCNKINIGKEPLYHYCFNEDSACNSIHLNRLADVEKIYGIYSHILTEDNDRNMYLLQIEKWLSTVAVHIINANVDFIGSNYIMQYIYELPFDKDVRLILYGAGKAGKDLYNYLVHYKYNVVLWVDKNFSRIHDERIHAVEDIESTSYDYIILACGTEAVSINMREFLSQYNVETEKIYWSEPMRIY